MSSKKKEILNLSVVFFSFITNVFWHEDRSPLWSSLPFIKDHKLLECLLSHSSTHTLTNPSTTLLTHFEKRMLKGLLSYQAFPRFFFFSWVFCYSRERNLRGPDKSSSASCLDWLHLLRFFLHKHTHIFTFNIFQFKTFASDMEYRCKCVCVWDRERGERESARACPPMCSLKQHSKTEESRNGEHSLGIV